MRNSSRIFSVLVLILGVMGYAGMCLSGDKPALVVPAQVDLAKETKIDFSGTGFIPGLEVVILFPDKNGIPTDIGYALKPPPKADANGNWKTTWNAKRFIQKKLIMAGEYRVSATDADFNELAFNNIKFVGKYVKKKKKK